MKSMSYPMTRNPRGKAIIINNVKDLAQRESERFKCIFTQLLFKVSMLFNLTAEEIENKMIEIRDEIDQEYENNDYKPQALIVMVISHGQDDRVYGKNYLNGSDLEDWAQIHDIVDIFGGDDDYLSGFVKMFFFNCCRTGNLIEMIIWNQ